MISVIKIAFLDFYLAESIPISSLNRPLNGRIQQRGAGRERSAHAEKLFGLADQSLARDSVPRPLQ